MIKKIICLEVILIICLGILYGCGDNPKIDIGGETVAGKPMSTMAVRIMLDKDTFHRDDQIIVNLGFGFRGEQSVSSFMEVGAVILFAIDATNFNIVDESEVKSKNEYEKEFVEYSDSKFVCDLDKKRYIPNYYEVFRFEFISDMQNGSGTIIISATLDYRDGGYDGKNERIYYAVNSDKIAFSSKSIEDAQKKLK